MTLQTTPKTTLRRRAQRGSYDLEVAHAILDAGLVCHVATSAAGEPRVLPMAYGRVGDTLYLHGARANALLGQADGEEICVCVTLVDGLVLAKSAFHHSMNYRCVVLFGRAVAVTDLGQKRAALDAIVEHALPGRTRECRAASPSELEATSVLALPIREGSVKVRTGPPVDASEDEALPHWSGEAPVRQVVGPAVDHGASVPAPPSVERASMRHAWGEIEEEHRDELVLSTARARIDIDFVHGFLAEQSYWAQGIPRATLVRSMIGSTCVGVYDGAQQVAFARLVSDGATFAYLADVFVADSHRGRGIARWIVGFLRERPRLRGVRRWMLATRDAQRLYEGSGFRPIARPDWLMEVVSGGS